MKRVVVVLPFSVLLLFYACMPADNGDVPSVYRTTVVQELTATMWTPTIAPTFNPEVSKIRQLLNEGFLQTDKLEMALDARYTVSNVWFMYLQDNSRYLYLEIHCACAFNSHCCTPERTFVITMHAMKKYSKEIIAQVPDYTVRMDVACKNSVGPIGVMSASWEDVRSYLREEIDGTILGWRVTAVPTPKP